MKGINDLDFPLTVATGEHVELSKLLGRDIGRRVRRFGQVEDGILKSWNHRFVFVVYRCDNRWEHFHDYTAAATEPGELQFFERDYE